MILSSFPRALIGAILRRSLTLILCLAVPAGALAQSAWLASPATANFNDPSNYAPAPNFGASPALSFGLSAVSDLSVSASATVSSLTFGSGASAYTFNGAPTISITNATTNAVVLANNSQATQVFNNPLSVVGSANARWNAVSGDVVLV